MRGGTCKPDLLRAENADGRVVFGTAKELAPVIGVNQNQVHHLKMIGRSSRTGWRVTTEKANQIRWESQELIAEMEGDDPIIGDVYEVAELTGYTVEYIKRAVLTGKRTRRGWSVRVKTEADNGKL